MRGDIVIDAAFNIYMADHDWQEFCDTLKRVGLRWRRYAVVDCFCSVSLRVRCTRCRHVHPSTGLLLKMVKVLRAGRALTSHECEYIQSCVLSGHRVLQQAFRRYSRVRQLQVTGRPGSASDALVPHSQRAAAGQLYQAMRSLLQEKVSEVIVGARGNDFDLVLSLSRALWPHCDFSRVPVQYHELCTSLAGATKTVLERMVTVAQRNDPSVLSPADMMYLHSLVQQHDEVLFAAMLSAPWVSKRKPSSPHVSAASSSGRPSSPGDIAGQSPPTDPTAEVKLTPELWDTLIRLGGRWRRHCPVPTPHLLALVRYLHRSRVRPGKRGVLSLSEVNTLEMMIYREDAVVMSLAAPGGQLHINQLPYLLKVGIARRDAPRRARQMWYDIVGALRQLLDEEAHRQMTHVHQQAQKFLSALWQTKSHGNMGISTAGVHHLVSILHNLESPQLVVLLAAFADYEDSRNATELYDTLHRISRHWLRQPLHAATAQSAATSRTALSSLSARVAANEERQRAKMHWLSQQALLLVSAMVSTQQMTTTVGEALEFLVYRAEPTLLAAFDIYLDVAEVAAAPSALNETLTQLYRTDPSSVFPTGSQYPHIEKKDAMMKITLSEVEVNAAWMELWDTLVRLLRQYGYTRKNGQLAPYMVTDTSLIAELAFSLYRCRAISAVDHQHLFNLMDDMNVRALCCVLMINVFLLVTSGGCTLIANPLCVRFAGLSAEQDLLQLPAQRQQRRAAGRVAAAGQVVAAGEQPTGPARLPELAWWTVRVEPERHGGCRICGHFS